MESFHLQSYDWLKSRDETSRTPGKAGKFYSQDTAMNLTKCEGSSSYPRLRVQNIVRLPQEGENNVSGNQTSRLILLALLYIPDSPEIFSTNKRSCKSVL